MKNTNNMVRHRTFKDSAGVSLSIARFVKYFNQDKNYTIQNKDDILDKLDWIDEDALERMERAKRKKFNQRQELRNDRNQTL